MKDEYGFMTTAQGKFYVPVEAAQMPVYQLQENSTFDFGCHLGGVLLRFQPNL
ncbi:hypothetical protein [Nitrosomonas aestuarii]|uniref:hypothetical protein n=1 Tax=Nitrosomonas aestuarii TaxID=52441 RepID=UPI000D4A8E6D|nr:hypothetical protein [Nitrosomonas aestuarii]PTN09418.1 hypothetical protein C8R11_1235 [Nitrosomonas aestuarii]